MNLVFKGTDDEDVMAFLQHIHKQALEQGYAQDDALIADLVAESLESAALTWFWEQDDIVQTSWRHLRRAMLAHFKAMPPVRMPSPDLSASTTAAVTRKQAIREALHLTTVKVCNRLR